MPELVAIAEADGWGVVRSGATLVVLQPPYQTCNRCEISELWLASAISKHGFDPASGIFPDWKSLIEELKKRQQDYFQKRGKQGISEQDLDEMCRELPADRLMELLAHVEEALLPKKKWHEAEKLLNLVLSAYALPQEPQLFIKANELKVLCLQGERAERL
ncbi:MAG: hypothetical protein HQM04_10105 [Magnetococcales bacterium]|nr:hypothetical protein [Magnetococcales bacterium]MBF0115383.1 hypothetical protein [Magnetococcales bacterium]